MTASRNRAVQLHSGGWPRPPAETRRNRFLYTDVTKAENDKIQKYCADNSVSVSQFLADLMLQDALKPKSKCRQKILVRAEFELTPEQFEKLELLTRLHDKETIGQFLYDILEPHLNIRRLHVPSQTITLRYYLSDEEHERLTRHLANKRISARNYAATLALKSIARKSKGHPQQP